MSRVRLDSYDSEQCIPFLEGQPGFYPVKVAPDPQANYGRPGRLGSSFANHLHHQSRPHQRMLSKYQPAHSPTLATLMMPRKQSVWIIGQTCFHSMSNGKQEWGGGNQVQTGHDIGCLPVSTKVFLRQAFALNHPSSYATWVSNSQKVAACRRAIKIKTINSYSIFSFSMALWALHCHRRLPTFWPLKIQALLARPCRCHSMLHLSWTCWLIEIAARLRFVP